MRFKIGDKVRCTSTCDDNVETGDIFIIDEIEDTWIGFTMDRYNNSDEGDSDDEDIANGKPNWPMDSFELVLDHDPLFYVEGQENEV